MMLKLLLTIALYCLTILNGFSANNFELKPFLKEYCLDCHGSEKEKGDRRFDLLDLKAMNHETGEALQEILDVINLAEMPPEKSDQPSVKLNEQAVDWLTERTLLIREQLDPRSRQTMMRRLNKVEYNHSIRDLFKIKLDDFNPSFSFPDDQEVEGLNTIGSGLVTSEFLLDEMLNSAKIVSERVVRPGAQPQAKVYEFKSDSKEMGENYFQSRLVGRQEIYFKKLSIQEDGRYDIMIKAVMLNRLRNLFSFKTYDPSKKARMVLYAEDSKNILPYKVKLGEYEIDDEIETEVNLSVELRKGARLYALWINGPAGSTKKIRRKVIPKYSKDAIYSATRNPMEMYRGAGPEFQMIEAEISGPHYDSWPMPAHKEYFSHITNKSSFENLKGSLFHLGEKAFRKPLDKGHEYAFVKVAEQKYLETKNIWDAAKIGVATILMSPDFHYQVETVQENESSLSSYEIANRLAYFLWSSIPDKHLLDLASKNKLKQDHVLSEEVTRMIQDSKSSGFVKNFSDHWLGLKELSDIQPNPKTDAIFYEYQLQESMGEEVRLFLEELLKKNGSISTLVNADYTYLNEGLAKLYDIPEVKGAHMRKVSLSKEHRVRGGLVGMAGLMTVTSNGVESLPVRRGAWVLESLLGTRAPLPPPDVPEITPDTSLATTIRDQLELHRQEPSCARCHSKFDHFGLALENFDHIGRYRETYKSEKKEVSINSDVETQDHIKFRGPSGLKNYLSKQTDQITQGLLEKMTTYAIGRRLTFVDEKEVNNMKLKLHERGNGLQSLVQLVVTSELFKNQ